MSNAVTTFLVQYCTLLKHVSLCVPPQNAKRNATKKETYLFAQKKGSLSQLNRNFSLQTRNSQERARTESVRKRE